MVNKPNVRLCEAPEVPEKQLKKEAEDNQFSKSTIHMHKHTHTHTKILRQDNTKVSD